MNKTDTGKGREKDSYSWRKKQAKGERLMARYDHLRDQKVIPLKLLGEDGRPQGEADGQRTLSERIRRIAFLASKSRRGFLLGCLSRRRVPKMY